VSLIKADKSLIPDDARAGKISWLMMADYPDLFSHSQLADDC
jgi:hypothetical protein